MEHFALEDTDEGWLDVTVPIRNGMVHWPNVDFRWDALRIGAGREIRR